jgi:hypothetical protein
MLIALAATWSVSSGLRAEQPPNVTPPPAEAKVAQPPRAKPQIIYRVPRTASYTATLHSQSKTQSHPLPIDSSMPISLQMSRAAANEAAARAEQEQFASANQPKKTVNRPKTQSVRPKVHTRGPSKARGPGKAHGQSGKK